MRMLLCRDRLRARHGLGRTPPAPPLERGGEEGGGPAWRVRHPDQSIFSPPFQGGGWGGCSGRHPGLRSAAPPGLKRAVAWLTSFRAPPVTLRFETKAAA